MGASFSCLDILAALDPHAIDVPVRLEFVHNISRVRENNGVSIDGRRLAPYFAQLLPLLDVRSGEATLAWPDPPLAACVPETLADGGLVHRLAMMNVPQLGSIAD